MKKMTVRRVALIFSAAVLALCILLALCVAVAFVYAKKTVDYGADEMLFAAARDGSVIRLYADRDPLDGVYEPVEVEVIYPSAERKEWVAYREIPSRVIRSFLAMEDREYFSHKGISLRRTAKAALNYLLGSRGGSFGGSTVTQQVVKNISGDNGYTVKRKLCEMLRAYHMEQMHSKEEILEVYLNILPMGENTAGISLAASRYFGKALSELDYGEIAVLVGIANAPARYNPHTAPRACIEKRNRVLYAMKEVGVIGEEEYEELIAAPLSVLAPTEQEGEVHSWFAETVLSEIREDLCRARGLEPTAADALIAKGGLSVYTTMDPSVQRALEAAFADASLLSAERKNGLQAAMVILDSESGNLLGIVGRLGKKEGNLLLNHALVPHTPGSALKPLALYAPLLDAGRIHPATVLDDVPLKFEKSGTSYRAYPKNYPAVYSGLITVKDALRLSKNTVALRLYDMLGAENIYRSLSRTFGFETLVRKAKGEGGETLTDLCAAPLALGQLTYGVSLRRLTEAYTVFASEGVLHSGGSYFSVKTEAGDVLLEKKREEKRVFSAEGARLMNQMLSEVVESGTAKSITLSRLVDTAGKTGTSGEDKDRLFVGYTPYYTAGIWMGYEGGDRAVGRASCTHLALWDRVMRKVHGDKLSYEAAEAPKAFSVAGLVRCSYCKDSGCGCGGFCHMDLRGEREERFFFLKNCRPTGACRTHIPVYYDTEREAPATEQSNPQVITVVALLFIKNRDFPCAVFVGDQKYAYNPPEASDKSTEGREKGESLPFFPFSRERKKRPRTSA